jgi:hypothetical protein
MTPAMENAHVVLGGGRWHLLALGLLGCGGTGPSSSSPEPAPAFSVDPERCPEAGKSSAGRIAHESYLRTHAELTHVVAVKLRTLPGSVPSCSADDEAATCVERDEALAGRQALNVKQFACVATAFGSSAALGGPLAAWYERALLGSDGFPVPIGTVFEARASWSQIEVVAAHPYVERIEPALGEASRIGVAAPTVPAECPAAEDPPAGKLTDVASIEGGGRLPAVIELTEESLPALRPCDGDGPCDDWFASGWERTIAGRRMLTCVRSFVDNVLTGPAPSVPYTTVDGVPDGPKLPPFGDVIHATLAFGLAVTWEEAREIARHPYVRRLWTSDALRTDAPPNGCPPDYESSVELPECSTIESDITGKFSDEARGLWESSPDPNEVLITVLRDGELCPAPVCPVRGVQCPELREYDDRMMEEALASQHCVRELIASLGGETSAEVFVLGNSFPARLTWPQIEVVLTRPEVIQIDPAAGPPPP